MKKESCLQIKVMRSYRGGEFTSKELSLFCEENVIKRLITVPRYPK